MKSWDAIVLGVGGMGSSTCYHLAARGKAVLGLEQFDLAHDKGSSHGETRLIRKAYFEHPSYVPLLKRSYELWDEISHRVSRPLLHRTGLVIWGPKNGTVLNGIRQSANQHSLAIEEWDSAKGQERFPLFTPPKDFHGIYESEGGFLEVEACVRAYVEEAKRMGAEIHFKETVLSWRPCKHGVEVTTDQGTYLTKKLILTVGPWATKWITEKGISLSVHRAPLFWFPASSKHTEASGFPCFAFDLPYGFIYGFPSQDGKMLKLALHHPGEKVMDPLQVNRNIEAKETIELERCLKENLPSVGIKSLKASVCLYTMTPDENFIIDKLPSCEDVIFACGFSGHGFKFASVIGEILADLALQGSTNHPIDFLRIRS